jgi:hypothetical protein
MRETALSEAGGTVQTRENNTVEGNTNNTNGTMTPIGGI